MRLIFMRELKCCVMLSRSISCFHTNDFRDGPRNEERAKARETHSIGRFQFLETCGKAEDVEFPFTNLKI